MPLKASQDKRQKAEQYAQQTQNFGHKISQSVQQVAEGVDQVISSKVDQVSQKVDDLVRRVSQLQGEKDDSLIQKSYQPTSMLCSKVRLHFGQTCWLAKRYNRKRICKEF